MKVIIDKLPPGASLGEVIAAYNKMAEKLNTALCEIDEENISESVMERIPKEV